MQEVFKISNLEQIRLLSDPFKLSIMQEFAEGERTTGEVARALKQPITRLYRHVDALHAAGLLEITREQQKRGTVERHFRAVGRRFEADHALFADDTDEDSDAIRKMFRASEDEIVNAIKSSSNDDREAIFLRLRMRGTPERLAELQRQLTAWVEEVQDSDDTGEEQLEAGALVAFYPIDPGAESSA
ncbi:MAG: helix-turn-helix domain-containing protein [Gammaproteobacteria bacterium]|nr:helix-turn-helix domain-containing protein [Gammaproteobacteria bacterium]MDH3416902.1 helix-turn-helix domain-containing protein [Gammaproteobacteria bacterium]